MHQPIKHVVHALYVLWNCSVFIGGFAVMFGAAAARGGEVPLWDDGAFFLYFMVITPSSTFGLMHLMDLWLQSLPSKVWPLRSTSQTADIEGAWMSLAGGTGKASRDNTGEEEALRRTDDADTNYRIAWCIFCHT